MSIIKANDGQFQLIKDVTISTIKKIYPLYYPRGAVDFFLSHHSDGLIYRELHSGYVFLSFNKEQDAVGTITVRENEICRLFILPQYQKQGHGRELLDFAEARIGEQYNVIKLDASLPAKAIYLKRGYIVTEFHSIQTKSGDFLCYDVMEKDLLDAKPVMGKMQRRNGD